MLTLWGARADPVQDGVARDRVFAERPFVEVGTGQGAGDGAVDDGMERSVRGATLPSDTDGPGVCGHSEGLRWWPWRVRPGVVWVAGLCAAAFEGGFTGWALANQAGDGAFGFADVVRGADEGNPAGLVERVAVDPVEFIGGAGDALADLREAFGGGGGGDHDEDYEASF